MLADTQLFFLWILFMAVPFWLIPGSAVRARQNLLNVTSFVFVFAFAPWAAMFVLWMCLAVLASTWFLTKWRNSTSVFVSVFVVCLPLLAQRMVYLDAALIATLGITFATLRAVSIVLDSYAARVLFRPHQVFLCLFFLPLYTVGPVETIKTFEQQNFAGEFQFNLVVQGVRRVIVGLFKSMYIAEELILGFIDERYPLAGRDFTTFDSPEALLFVLCSFMYTYLNFSGFVDIAVGVSRLFGLKTIENFNYPLAARDLRDFWRRWHISLGNWIAKYLYFPIVAKMRNRAAPYVATFIAFVIIGWWHDTTLSYITWGILHGSGLCLVLLWQRTLNRQQSLLYGRLQKNLLYNISCWCVTIVYVAWVQTFANLGSWDQSMQMTRALVGF